MGQEQSFLSKCEPALTVCALFLTSLSSTPRLFLSPHQRYRLLPLSSISFVLSEGDPGSFTSMTLRVVFTLYLRNVSIVV